MERLNDGYAEQMLYVVGTVPDAPVKIGISDDPMRRLRGIQTGNPLKLQVFQVWAVTHPVPIEGSVHIALAEQRMVGEWFGCSLMEAHSAITNAPVRGLRTLVYGEVYT